MIPRSGDVLVVDSQASVQFAGSRQLVFRVIFVRKWTTYDGWLWLHGYVLDGAGNACERREIFVRHEGLRLLQPRPGGPTGRNRRAK
ncbi:hypothetical protein [Actinoplanes sp. NBRC 101535]|uniref:hypothetical protein n=1 Tax=Actinoplanes sp. NBRC 101535 TaxID=3032196 RepID=UPI00249FF210|nr:hypothetical protein [Actinoplanes sp. NBRC 101535]GLY08611.1 hypothetical protein Acsp01_89900 [Actinoplanes sp. NBRC 101535]